MAPPWTLIGRLSKRSWKLSEGEVTGVPEKRSPMRRGNNHVPTITGVIKTGTTENANTSEPFLHRYCQWDKSGYSTGLAPPHLVHEHTEQKFSWKHTPTASYMFAWAERGEKPHRSYRGHDKNMPVFPSHYKWKWDKSRSLELLQEELHRCGTTTPCPPCMVPLLYPHGRRLIFLHVLGGSATAICPVRHTITTDMAVHSQSLFDSTLKIWRKRSNKFHSQPWFLTN